MATAKRLGIASPLNANASLALGTSEVVPIELTAAYATFATGGLRVTPYTVAEVRSVGGQVLYRRPAQQQPRVVEEDRTLWLNGMLFDVVQSGTGTAARVPGHEVAGKTGTTSDFKDAWFVGFSPDLVTGVWVGNDDSTPMKHVTGGNLPAQIWSGFMRAALKGHPALTLARSTPTAPIDIATQMPPDVPAWSGTIRTATRSRRRRRLRRSAGTAAGCWIGCSTGAAIPTTIRIPMRTATAATGRTIPRTSLLRARCRKATATGRACRRRRGISRTIRRPTRPSRRPTPRLPRRTTSPSL